VNVTACLLTGIGLAIGAVSAAAMDGERIYREHCASCHAPDGKGRTPAGKKLGVKDLSASTLPDAEIARQILEGTTEAKGKARMPAFKEKLGPAEVASLAVYIKKFRK